MNLAQGLLILGALGLANGTVSTSQTHDAKRKPQERQVQVRHLDLRDIARQATVSLLDAMRAASKAQSGAIVEAGLEGEAIGKKQSVFFEIMILDALDTLHELKVDATSGIVTENSTEDDQEEVRGFKAAIRNSELGILQLIQKATAIIKGRPLSACLQMEDEGPECEIVFVNTRYLIEASIETRAGHLVDLELKKDTDRRDEEEDRDNVRD